MRVIEWIKEPFVVARKQAAVEGRGRTNADVCLLWTDGTRG